MLLLHVPVHAAPLRTMPPIGLPAPFTPASYIALRRKAAGVTIGELAELIAAHAGIQHARRLGKSAAQAELRALLRQLETPGVVARQRVTLDMIARAMPFDPDVYVQLATAPAHAHPRICRGCGCTQDDACRGRCRWAGDEICTRCTDGELL